MYASTAEQRRNAQVQVLAGQIYDAHRSRLLAIARRNCEGAEQAEEALQDAFVLFIDRFDPAGGAPPLAWLTLTLKRRCWALYRQQRLDWSNHRQAQVDFGKPGLSVGSKPPEHCLSGRGHRTSRARGRCP